MAAHTPLPPNLRWGLAAFSSSLFINNKTRDSGAAHTYPPGTGSGAGGLGEEVAARHSSDATGHF